MKNRERAVYLCTIAALSIILWWTWTGCVNAQYYNGDDEHFSFPADSAANQETGLRWTDTIR